MRKKINPEEIRVESRSIGPRREYVVFVGGLPRAYCSTPASADVAVDKLKKEMEERKRREQLRMMRKRDRR